eukprot:TRINITY_DN3482_c0_g2_i4.p1 TRINITY_DN3482_c0_g2~~TRINITY_DN3482_c0_g2_i4.p1  ORF type:complete len:234 (+),score=62.89 TRINITY_DN3482_c0_g2_i4:134-835(+)
MKVYLEMDEGNCVYPNGDEYQGFWVDGQRSGEGLMKYSSGDSFFGQWKDDQIQDGKGKYTFSNGSSYEGNFLNGLKHGQGSAVYVATENQDADKSSLFATYTGEWEYNQPSGIGKATYLDGATYSGHFKENNRDGLGVYIGSNGDEFFGQWKLDKPHGVGRLRYWKCGEYEGVFRNGRKHGCGVFLWPHALLTMREYFNGEMISEQTISEQQKAAFLTTIGSTAIIKESEQYK